MVSMQVSQSNGRLITHRGTDQMSKYIKNNKSQVSHCQKKNANTENIVPDLQI